MSMLKYYSDNTIYFHHMLDEAPDPGYFTMHNHMLYEIFYFISGKGYFYIEGNEYPLHSGDVLIMRNDESHYISINRDVPYERISLLFDKKLIESIDPDGDLLKAFEMRNLGEGNHFTQNDFKDKMYSLLFNNILSMSNTKLRLQVLTNLFALLNEIRIASENTEKNRKFRSESLESGIISYINNHLQEHLSLDDICKCFYINKSQLCRIFKKTMGVTVWEYITVKRLSAARNMILFGMPPTKIFSECGFSDYSVFYRAYRKHFGCSPTMDSYEEPNILS